MNNWRHFQSNWLVFGGLRGSEANQVFSHLDQFRLSNGLYLLYRWECVHCTSRELTYVGTWQSPSRTLQAGRLGSYRSEPPWCTPCWYAGAIHSMAWKKNPGEKKWLWKRSTGIQHRFPTTTFTRESAMNNTLGDRGLLQASPGLRPLSLAPHIFPSLHPHVLCCWCCWCSSGEQVCYPYTSQTMDN